ncbi:MAG: ROK family protein, partial [Candidatus Hydrogenedentes bacterium]|nr:ROK family protein [Candidatus Hydrogenedentota bacterium]
GGTKLQAVIGTADGEIIETVRGSARPEQGAPAILAWIEETVPSILGNSTARAIAMGFGGPVETATGKILVSHQVAGWEGFEMKPWLEQRFGMPAIVANDSNAAGWAEYRLGAGRGTSIFCYMNIGSGIGGALVIHGHLHDGQGRGGGELGHTWVPDWTAPMPGAADKLEHLCSGWSIEKRLRAGAEIEAGSPLCEMTSGDRTRITCAMLGPAAQKGDPVAQGELARVGETIGIALANVVTLFHPERIAVGGGVALIGEPLLDPIRRSVNSHVFGPFRGRCQIVACELGEQVVTAGALLLAGAAVDQGTAKAV